MAITGTKLSEILDSGNIESVVYKLLLKAYKAGQITYNPATLTHVFDTGINGVRINAGQEEYYLVCNNTGGDISNGKFCYASGVDETTKCVTIGLADNSAFFTSAQVLGAATHLIPDDTLGLVTTRGVVNDMNTNALNEGGIAWLGTAGDATVTQPVYPAQRILLGTVLEKSATIGKMLVTINRLTRNDISKSYPFTSTGVGAGTYWIGGFYDFATTSIALNQGSLTQTYGTVNIAKAAHAGVVPSAAGVVDTGQVGLRVTGIMDYEDGTPQTAAQTGIITEDITTLTLDEYAETVEKFSGVVTFELYVVSGTPVNYSLTFNYGFAKYDDIQDRDYTIFGFECKWQGNAASTFDIALIKHGVTGWTYAATGFVAGNGDVCRKSVDQALAGDVANNNDGAYKRKDLNTYIKGQSGLEGHIIQVITGANGTAQILNCHVDVVSEELDF